jgi:hypothetical protein
MEPIQPGMNVDEFLCTVFYGNLIKGLLLLLKQLDLMRFYNAIAIELASNSQAISASLLIPTEPGLRTTAAS